MGKIQYPDRFAGLRMRKGNDATFRALLGLSPLAKSWKAIPVEVDKTAGPDPGDFPSFSPYNSPVFSKNAVVLLEPLMTNSVEVLPLGTFDSEEYFAIHVVEEVDALNQEKSKFSIVDGQRGSVTKFVFHEERLAGKHIFRIPELRLRPPVVSPEFKKAVESHKLRGAKFGKLP
jgi:hypothetical protein